MIFKNNLRLFSMYTPFTLVYMFYSLSLTYAEFFRERPALLYGLAIYLGCHLALSLHLAFVIPFFVYFFPLAYLAVIKRQVYFVKVLLMLFVCISGYYYTRSRIVFPPDDFISTSGVAEVVIENITQGKRWGRAFWKLQLRLITFTSNRGESIVKDVPCSYMTCDKGDRLHAGFVYRVQGELVRKGTYHLQLRAKPSQWKKNRAIFSLVEARYSCKENVKSFFTRLLPAGHARNFLIGMLIGELDDAELCDELSQFGLKHIIVISGFHFGVCIFFFTLITRLFLQERVQICVLMLAATLYVLFVGESPSCARAWVAICIVLGQTLIRRQSTGLNSLGVGLLAVLMYDPAFVVSLSFQLSFLATGALLLFFPVFQNLLQKVVYKRSFQDLLKWSWMHQGGYMMLAYFRTSLALVLSVSVLTAPVCLWAFKTFSLIGLFYNCFFPTLAAISMLSFGLALVLYIVPYIGKALLLLSHSFTEAALSLVLYAPNLKKAVLICHSFSDWVLAIYLPVCILCGITLHVRLRKSEEIEYAVLFT